MPIAAAFDQSLFRVVGYPYMRITRDDSSFERVRYLTRFIRNQNQPVRVLDAGCGGAISLYMIEREAQGLVTEFVGADFKASRLTKRYQHFKTPNRFFNTSLDDDWNFGEFDVAWCSECLEHIMDDNGTFQKICRSVRPGGHVLVSMPSESYRKNFAGPLPEMMLTSPTQDGGHVRVGYTPDSLVALARGTSARLIQVDAITRSDLTYLRRRYRWGHFRQILRNVYYSVTRKESDYFKFGATTEDLQQFQSIAAIYRIE